MNDHAFSLGSIRLTSSLPDPEHGFWFETYSEGTSFGSSDAVTSVVQTMLADGDLVRIDRFGNREVPLAVKVCGPTLGAVARGEAALRAELGRANTLTWQPPDSLAPATVFEVVTSWFDPEFDDLEELRRSRSFKVTLWCKPHARSVDLVNVEGALFGNAAMVLVDDCNSATGWEGRRGNAPVTPSTAWQAGSVGIAELDEHVTSPEFWGLTRTGSVDFTTTPYLVAEVRTLASDSGGPLRLGAWADGFQIPLVAMERMADDPTYFRVVWDVRARGVVTSLLFIHYSRPGDPWQGVFIRKVERTATVPSGMARRSTQVVANVGTERTPVSMRLSAPDGTSNLGFTVIHTAPSLGIGATPPLSTWRHSGNTRTADAAAVSGYTEPLHPDPVVYRHPVSAVPEGGYLVAALISSGVAGPRRINFDISTLDGTGTVIPGTLTNNATTHTFAAPWTWELVPLAVLELPTARTTLGSVSVAVVRAAGETEHLAVDEGFLFRAGPGCALTVLQANGPHVWLDSAGVDGRTEPTVWVGDSLTDRRHPAGDLVSTGPHVLHPEGTDVTVVHRDVTFARVTGSYYPRWPHNAAL